MTAAFDAPEYRFDDLLLRRFSAENAVLMAARVAHIDPWARLGIKAPALATLLTARKANGVRLEVLREGEPVAAIVVRTDWLYGPYIALLAVLPEAQGRGVGAALLAFVEAEARAAGDKNLWVAASAFNAAAIGFYERHGFAEVGPMPDLVRDGFTEILFRKRLLPPSGSADETS